jgi:hypothetical protein
MALHPADIGEIRGRLAAFSLGVLDALCA